MALQYARAMGCETWALSTSAGKEAEARKFGAAHFLVTTDKDAMAAARGSFDLLLCCATGASLPFNDYLRLLKPRATLCLVGAPSLDQPAVISPFSLIAGEKQFVGSLIGGTAAMADMLAFSAAHTILPQCEIIPFEAANEGFERMKANSARYRTVLDMTGAEERLRAAGK